MMRLAKFGSQVLVASLACGVVACSGTEVSSPEGAAGEGVGSSLRLALQPVSGISLNTVHYVVTKVGLAAPVLEGDLPTPGNASVLNIGLPVPVGTGYALSLSGVAAESVSMICSGAVGPFEVRPNQNTTLNTQLACTDLANGALKNEIMQTVDGCPRLIVDFALATPNSAKVGQAIGLVSYAHDLDGKSVAYLWGVTDSGAGSFTSATVANTAFICQASAANLGLTLIASNGECAKSIVTSVACTSD